MITLIHIHTFMHTNICTFLVFLLLLLFLFVRKLPFFNFLLYFLIFYIIIVFNITHIITVNINVNIDTAQVRQHSACRAVLLV